MKKVARILFLLTFLLAFLYGWFSPPKGDYNAYQGQWKIILAGQNPWGYVTFTDKDNAYGPVFAVFALPMAIHYKLPRLIFVLTWALASVKLIEMLLESEQLSDRWKITLLLVLCLSPFLWIRNVHYAQFDIVVAYLLLLSIDYAVKNMSIVSGGLIAVAVALKYYPLAVVPQLAFKDRKPVWRFIGSFGAVMTIIYTITYGLWGTTFLKPIFAAVERQSKLLSIYQVLRSPFSPLANWFGVQSLDRISTPAFLIGLILLTVYLLYRKFDPISGSLLAFVLTLLLYKVGHQQFHVCLYLLLIYWFIATAPHNKMTVIASGIYVVFLNIADIGYLQTSFVGQWEIIRNLIGLPIFIILSFLFVAIWLEAKQKQLERLSTDGVG
jgi:hypothetical protein